MRYLSILIMLAVFTLPVLAQDTNPTLPVNPPPPYQAPPQCRAGLPCGAAPWELPEFPTLIVPTRVDGESAPPTTTPPPASITPSNVPPTSIPTSRWTATPQHTQTPPYTQTPPPTDRPTWTPRATWTEWPTWTVTAEWTATGEWTATAPWTETPLPTATERNTVFDDLQDQIGGISNTFSTAQAVVGATPIPLFDAEGQPAPAIESFYDDMSYFFGLVKGVNADIAGPFSPMVTVALTGMLVIIAIKMASFMLPIAAAIFGFIRKVIVLILEFIPG
jgi:hypothetical protein